jgi:hypothetical protein
MQRLCFIYLTLPLSISIDFTVAVGVSGKSPVPSNEPNYVASARPAACKNTDLEDVLEMELDLICMSIVRYKIVRLRISPLHNSPYKVKCNSACF